MSHENSHSNDSSNQPTRSMDEILNSFNEHIADEKRRRKEMFARYRPIMVGVFTKIGLSEARAHFDGSCDSGMVDDIRLPEDFTTDIEEIEVIADDQVISLYDFLEEFAYEILEDKVGGWEIDAGGFGDVIFRCDGSITLEFNGRIEDYYHDEYEIFDEMEDEE